MKKLLLLLTLIAPYAYGQSNPNAGLVAYYPLNGNVGDSSGNGHHGTAYGSPGYTTDQWGNLGKALAFDGTNDYVLIPPHVQLTPDTAFSVGFRFKADTIVGQCLITKSTWLGAANNSTNDIQYQIGFAHSQYVGGSGVFIGTDHNNNCTATSFLSNHYSSQADSLTSATWYCVLAVFEHGVKRLYVDGILMAQDTIAGFMNNQEVDSCPGGELKLGAWWVQDPQFFKGAMDEVRIYNRALSPAEAEEYCQATNPLAVKNVQNYSAPSLKIYPNPANDLLHIDVDSEATAKIYSVAGRLMHSFTVKEHKVVDVSGYPAGLYFVKVGNILQKFIKY